MLLRLFTLISVLLLSFVLANESSATYVPGTYISMTGSTASGTRFDVAGILFDSGADATPPALETATKNFTGTFYTKDIGWIMFSTGSYQVTLDCGIQTLDNLTTNCILSSTGWSENVGDIGFSGVVYNPNTGLLEGKALSWIGDIDLTGIILPLKPVEINETTLIANHTATLSISGASLYEGGTTPWNLHINPTSSLDIRNAAGTKGIFSIDLSLATDYDIEITDTNGSKTIFTNIPVIHGTPNTSLEAGSFYASDFCTSYSSDTARCIDGASRSATTLIQVPPGGPVLANGSDSYNYTFKARDKYGNRVENGSVNIEYITTVKNVQIDIADNSNLYGSLISLGDGDAVIPNNLTNSYFGTSGKIFALGSSDTIYTIASTAPTNVGNKIQLDFIKYNGTDIAIPGWKGALDFDPIYTANVTFGTPIINTPNAFAVIVAGNDPSTTIPAIISTMKINDGSSAEWRTLSSNPVATCVKEPFSPFPDPLCDWGNVSVIATTTGSSFIFTGTYSPIIATPPLESTSFTGYIYYKIIGKDILYQTQVSSITPPTMTAQRIKVFGQSGEGLNIGAQTRVNLINSLREKAALLSRNRSNYMTADYVIYNGNHAILDAEFTAKRTIITIGGNLTISDNIINRAHPLAIIALADANGNGGNIIIDGSVTDIHSTLIAEHAITSTVSTSQLYVHGSLISANPPRESTPTTCPYFAPSCADPLDYDLPKMRSGFTTTSVGGSAHTAPLVIEMDTRVMSDPPPAMDK